MINGLRAQLGGEMAKEKSTKSGQSTDELYSSNWIHYDKLAFLVSAIGASKSRQTLKRINFQEDENEKEVGGTPVAKRKTLTGKKTGTVQKLLQMVMQMQIRKHPYQMNLQQQKCLPFIFKSRKSSYSWINAIEE